MKGKGAKLALLLGLLFVIGIWFVPRTQDGRASVRLLGYTNDGSGQPAVVLCFTNASSTYVFAKLRSMDCETPDGWRLRQPLPKAMKDEIWTQASSNPLTKVTVMPGDPIIGLYSQHNCVMTVHFPTNSSWRLRVQFDETTKGLGVVFGMTEDVLRSLRGNPSPWRPGQSYEAVSPVIRP